VREPPLTLGLGDLDAASVRDPSETRPTGANAPVGYVVRTDGAARGNPGPASAGAVLLSSSLALLAQDFTGPARVVESQEEAVSVILTKQIQPGDVLVVRYEGPAGGPGMQEMLHPTAFLKGAGLGRVCALITDGRFSGGSSGISVGHISPEAAAGGVICHDCGAGDGFTLDQSARSFMAAALASPLKDAPAAEGPTLMQVERALSGTVEYHAHVRLRSVA